MASIYDLDTPALLTDLDRLERNLATMATVAEAGGKRLRPHTKTHKTPEIARMQVNYGARGLTTAKLGEAEALADAGFDDLFIANELIGDAKAERLLTLLDRARVRIGVDSVEIAEFWSRAAQQRGVRVSMLIEVDTGLGRAGVRSTDEALGLAQQISALGGLDLLGIFTHEGHLYRAPERPPVAGNAAEQMRAIACLFGAHGLPCETVSVGSTPGAPLMAHEPGLTELRPGVYVFNDRTQVRMGADVGACALTVLAAVVSKRPDGKVIVDAGTKSMASDCPFEDRTYGTVLDHPELSFVGASEEHGHLLASGATSLRVGDKVRIVPNHACTCVNMHDTLIAFRGETIEAVWPIAGRGKIR